MNYNLILAATAGVIICIGNNVQAQRAVHNYGVDIFCNSGDALISTNTSTVATDRVGAYGKSTPQPNWGIGVQGEGGYIGVSGQCNISGVGYRCGVLGTASNGSDANYGVMGEASGNEPWAGYFQGNVFCAGTYQSSDAKLKKNISDLSGSLSKVLKLRAKSYEYDDENNPEMNLSKGIRVGLIAQDVEKVLPEIVKDVTAPQFSKNKQEKNVEKRTFKAINYTELIPVLINAIQEQQKQIEDLKALVSK